MTWSPVGRHRYFHKLYALDTVLTLMSSPTKALVEAALEGCSPGDSVEVVIAPEKAFGYHDPGLTFTDDIDNVPPQFRRVGAEVQMQNDRGEVRSFFVSRIEDGKLTLDGNHPFAGKTLTYAVTVVDIRDASEQEQRNGVSMPVMH